MRLRGVRPPQPREDLAPLRHQRKPGAGARVRRKAGKAGKAKGAQTAAGKARAALSKTSRAEAAEAAGTPAATPTATKAPTIDPMPPITVTMKDSIRIEKPMPGVSDRTGAASAPAAPASALPMPKTAA